MTDATDAWPTPVPEFLQFPRIRTLHFDKPNAD